jgi:hypothetical protein
MHDRPSYPSHKYNFRNKLSVMAKNIGSSYSIILIIPSLLLERSRLIDIYS